MPIHEFIVYLHYQITDKALAGDSGVKWETERIGDERRMHHRNGGKQIGGMRVVNLVELSWLERATNLLDMQRHSGNTQG